MTGVLGVFFVRDQEVCGSVSGSDLSQTSSFVRRFSDIYVVKVSLKSSHVWVLALPFPFLVVIITGYEYSPRGDVQDKIFEGLDLN